MTNAHRSTEPEALKDMTPEQRRALLAQLLQDRLRAARAAQTIAPLSYGQAALWFTHAMAPESPAYNVAFTAAVRSPVDVAAMGRAFQRLVDRHPALRTTFQARDGKPQQVIAGSAELDFVQVDAAGWDEAELHARVSAAYQAPFNLETGPLLRVVMFTRGPANHVLLVALHHIVFDGWSMGILLDEFQMLYRAECGGAPAENSSGANLPPLQHTYTDYVAWQRALLDSEEGHRLRSYWHHKLSGTLPVLDLPTDRPRPPVQTSRGASHELRLSQSLTRQIRALAKAEHTTLYGVLLAAFFVLLHRHSGQDDFIVGTPMVGRTRAEFQRTIGYFVSPVALRAELSGEPTFRQLLAQVRQTVLEALEHQDYPFARLVEALQPRRIPGRSPIIEALFNVQQVQRLGQMADRMVAQVAQVAHERSGSAGNAAGQLDLELFHVSQEDGQFDLNVLLFEAGDDVFGGLKYNLDLFDEATMARMGDHYLQLLESIVANPASPIGALPMLTASERQQLAAWNATEADYPRDRCLHDLISAQAERTPASIAVRCNGQDVNYGELERRSNQLAHTLRQRGVSPGVLVGVLVDRSPDMLLALLGVLKAGGAYVPLDPAFPAERLTYMLRDSGAAVLLTQNALIDRVGDLGASMQVLSLDGDAALLASQPAHAPQRVTTSDDLAYVIYTSGSTGRPKGVQIPHRAVVNFMSSMARRPGLAANDVLAAVTTLSFDIAALELFLPLTVGARVVVVERDVAGDGTALAEALQQEGVTVMQATPTTWRLLLAAEWRSPPNFKALCGGETLPLPLAQRLLELGVELWNMYGPTETTIWSAVHRVTSAESSIPIGRPIANTQVYVLNAHFQHLPIGVPGVLYVGGDGLACSYLNRPELMAERFVPNPAGSGRLYNTGDLARICADGTLEVLGRIDLQVKIRGFRIELGEIEATLSRFKGVREAAVAAHPDVRGDLRLVAYLVAADADGPRPGAGELRAFLRISLPDYMIPSAFVLLDKLPLTANGKVDRRALLPPDKVQIRGDEQFAPPSTPTEQAIAAAWREMLNLDRVGVYDNFFDLGGHSLLAVEALARLNKHFNVKLGPADIRFQTLGQLAATYDRHMAQAAEAAPMVATSAPTQDDAAPTKGLFGAVRRIIVRKPDKPSSAVP